MKLFRVCFNTINLSNNYIFKFFEIPGIHNNSVSFGTVVRQSTLLESSLIRFLVVEMYFSHNGISITLQICFKKQIIQQPNTFRILAYPCNSFGYKRHIVCPICMITFILIHIFFIENLNIYTNFSKPSCSLKKLNKGQETQFLIHICNFII